MTAPVIERAEPAEARALAELIAEAFHPLAATAWLVPDPAVRPKILTDDFHILVEYAIEWGLVETTEDRRAVAVWLPAVGDPLPPPADYDNRLAAACGELTDRFRLLDDLFEANHPHDPHHHLAFLAVAPDRQRQGIGSALLRHRHAWLDEQGLPAYLDASSTDSRDLYARHGYKVAEPFRLPDGTPFWPMWRPAGG
ncbi:GNAT family N-acetyltransferase [Micromonospora sp. NBC_01796]|uniref:GNAT family N-acetyltransferase n=1 Tax=Micromonospora sp. NBC_01796 TaxID=2975987 RepID=UPI002DD7E555|nr:GNAT family N-acetyltransferase [Micromonospora sp. NBC_01796]WSA86297.1 GNAT family N-acetyltransferase [Micromonospora sp. NBC_01796]